MRISRRALIKAFPALATGVYRPVFSQEYPSKLIRFIVPASPGTAIDVTARYFAEQLSKRLKVSVVVENRAGAGGLVGIESAAKAPPDGYTLLVIGVPLYTTPWTSDTPVGFDPVKDFIPVAKLNGAALAFVVPTDSPYKTLEDLVRDMKSKPGDIMYSSGGSGSTSHLCTVMLNDATQSSARHIPYKGNSPAVTDTVGGQVNFTCNSSAVIPLVKGGRLRALAVTSRERWEELPTVPTAAEAGIPGFEVSSWIGVMAPTGTPAPIVERLSEDLVQLARTPQFKEFCSARTMFLDIADHKQFQAEAPREAERWKRIALLSKGS